MAIQTINVGNVVNDGLGDDLRSAFRKVNNNFSELNSNLAVTASNIGSVGVGLFKSKNNNTLEFKNLTAGTGVTVEDFPNTVRISSRSFTSIATDTQTIQASFSTGISIKGGLAPNAPQTSLPDIEVNGTGNEIIVRTIIPVTDILTVIDFGDFDHEYTNVIQFILANNTYDFGSIISPSSLSLDLGGILI